MSEEIVVEIATTSSLQGDIQNENYLQGNIQSNNSLQGMLGYGSYQFNKDYNKMYNQPSIEGVTLIDNKTFEDLGATGLTNLEIENLLNLQV